jgi:hypothetical protein
VVPSIRRYFDDDNTIAHVLALPLLYACLDKDMKDKVPLTISLPKQQKFEQVRLLDVDVNPVTRVHLYINRAQDRLQIDERVTLAIDVGGNAIVQHDDRQQQEQNTNTILTHMQQLKQEISTKYDQLQQSVTSLRSEMTVKHQIIQRNINRIFIQPPRQSSTTTTTRKRSIRQQYQSSGTD